MQAINCQRMDALVIPILKSRLAVHGLALNFSHALILADEEVELLIRVSERANLVLFVDGISTEVSIGSSIFHVWPTQAARGLQETLGLLEGYCLSDET